MTVIITRRKNSGFVIVKFKVETITPITFAVHPKMLLKIFTIFVFFAFGLLTIACPAPCDMSDEEVKTVYAELAPVIQTIENFRKDQKIYPQTLNELLPKYLEKIPLTVGNRKFEYIRVSDERYNVLINAKNGGSYSGRCSYQEVDERWKDLGGK